MRSHCSWGREDEIKLRMISQRYRGLLQGFEFLPNRLPFPWYLGLLLLSEKCENAYLLEQAFFVIPSVIKLL